ncbi:hypothetical protein ACQUWL_20380 [Serratia marcescens]
MKTKSKKKKAAASANAAAGTEINPAWFENVNAELLRPFSS